MQEAVFEANGGVELGLTTFPSRMPAIIAHLQSEYARLSPGLQKHHPLHQRSSTEVEVLFWDAVEKELTDHFASEHVGSRPEDFAFTPVELKIRGIIFVITPIRINETEKPARVIRVIHLPKEVPGLLVDVFSVVKGPEYVNDEVQIAD